MDQLEICSGEFESVPLKQRLKLLLASRHGSVEIPAFPSNVGVEERANRLCDSQMSEAMPVPKEERCAENAREGEFICANASVVDAFTKVDSLQGSILSRDCVSVKVECAENIVESAPNNSLNNSSLAGIQADNIELDLSEEYLDQDDHVVLKERLKRLLASNCLGLASAVLQDKLAETVNAESRYIDQSHEIGTTSTSGLSKSANPSQKECSKYESDIRIEQGPVKPTLAKIKVEQLNYDELQTFNMPEASQISSQHLVLLKTEVQDAGEEHEDELDHMLLRERMKLLPSRDDPSLPTLQNSNYAGKMFTSGCAEPVEAIKLNRSRKRRKTATDSIVVALEEDAPGLWQVLVDKGVSIDEIKLYGEPESDDLADDTSSNGDFVELEEVITKLFFRRESLLKLGRRNNKAERVSYCLECLFSLVEQARYLQFRKWPVEWGWCRELQSFIFVFERHNRIVLERPEYGYATYFFELADSLPINWQVKRLVIAMKLTTCSRATMIENRPLTIGEELSEGEAKVLMEYGWTPNTSLAMMLNYSGRVIHDKWNEKDRTEEWRSKIGKLLMDGISGGTLVVSDFQIKQEHC